MKPDADFLAFHLEPCIIHRGLYEKIKKDLTVIEVHIQHVSHSTPMRQPIVFELVGYNLFVSSSVDRWPILPYRTFNRDKNIVAVTS